MRRPASRPLSRWARGAGIGALALVTLGAAGSGCEVAINVGALQGGCPPPMVKISGGAGDAAVTKPFCIDASEVTVAQYLTFMGAGFTMAQADIPGAPDSGVGGSCAGFTTLVPGGNVTMVPGAQKHPITNVSWCQAYTYCKWAGKRLCGQIGGGPLDKSSDTTAALSEWLFACSNGGTLTYPYGDTFDQDACGGMGGGDSIENVDFYPKCVGGFKGLVGMSGNVWEWTDACASSDPGAFCDAMGGGFDSTQTELECVSQRNWTRTATNAANIGFRCCLDLP